MFRFDIVVVGDFRFPGGTSVATAHEIRALARDGLSIGLVQSNAAVLRQQRPVHPLIRATIDNGEAVLVPAGAQQVEGRLAIIHNPVAFTAHPIGLPKIKAGRAMMVAHQPHTDRNGVPYYSAARVQETCRAIAGTEVEWAPISPAVRDNLRRTAPALPLTEGNWNNILFPEEWIARRNSPREERPVIGRHSRPDKDKWPATRRDILEVYPDDPSIAVRILGAGDHLKRLMGEYPENWTAHRFGEVEPQRFLSEIDFFVYYHHPDWFEAFGRTVMEACASGAVAILPPHFEETFGEAAVYRPASEAVETARSLHGDWKRYRQQSNRGIRYMSENHGPQRHVAFIRSFLGTGATPPRHAARLPIPFNPAPKDVTMPKPPSLHLNDPVYDVVMIADMRNPGDAGLRIAHEIRIQHMNGYRTALFHMPSGRIKAQAVRGEIQACVKEGLAQILMPGDSVSARLVVIHAPEESFEPIPEKLPRISAEKIVAVTGRAPDKNFNVMRKHRLLSLAFQMQPVWAPTSAAVREALKKAWADVPLENDDWTVALAPRAWKEKPHHWDKPVIGRIETEPAFDFGTGDKDAKPPAPPAFAGCYQRILQAAPVSGDQPLGPVERLAIEEQAMGRFLDSLDVLYVDQDDVKPVALCAIAEAMQRGVIVLAKGELARDLGPGAIGCGAAKAEETAKILVRSRADLEQLRCDAARNASARFAPSLHAERIARLTGQPVRPLAAAPEKRKRIAFITSNGVGLGHLTRLLCIARRLPANVDPIFVTMSQAFGIVKDFGFPVEYVPFSSQCEKSDVLDWNDWFQNHIEQIFDAYNISGAVFDGGAPYGGLCRALASRPDFFSVWVRRGMWRPGKANDNLVKRQKYFDLVIEPSDVAGERDHGPTAGQAGRAAHTNPIRLLDAEELLDRKSAAKALGIDPNRPAVLIQLGSGNTSEIVSQTNAIVEACAKFPQLQIVIAEWAIGAVSFDVWPDVKVLRGFPLSRYYNAFDFTISAVGYNSFNEIMSFGLPAIFVANENPMMDDQAGRAAYAVEQGAALMASPDDLKDLHLLVGALMDERARSVIKVNAARIALPNGAQEAADLIVKLAGVTPEAAPPVTLKPKLAVRTRKPVAPAKAKKKAGKTAKRIKERV